MKRRSCPERSELTQTSGQTLRSSAMISSVRVSLLAAAIAVGGFCASPAHALTATAQPALLNHHAMAKPVEQVGYYYGRPYYGRRFYGRPYGYGYYPHRHYYGAYYRPYYSYSYAYPYYDDYEDYSYGYPYAYGYGYPYAYGYGA